MPIFPKPNFNSNSKKKEMPAGLWQKCPDCKEVLSSLQLTQSLQVCPKCQHHFTLGSMDRIRSLVDPDSFEEMDSDLVSMDVFKFKGQVSYEDRLKTYRKKTGLRDALISGTARMEGIPLVLAVMDFSFLAASMGSVVGEKVTRAVETATKRKQPIVIVTASGGARVYEGMLSLMQLAKTSGALALHREAGLPYITILTNPTTAGVMASFASLGDVMIAEPGCMIGFAGPRVIKETTHQDLPPGFQTAEFLQDHGLVDMIVHRRELRSRTANILRYLTSAA